MFEYRHNKCVGPHSPAASTFNKIMEMKKTWELVPPRLSLQSGSRIASKTRISNVKPAHVERYIYTPTPDDPEPIYTQTNPLRAIPY